MDVKPHYDPNLRARLHGNNGDSEVVLNSSFRDWQNHVTADLGNRKREHNYADSEEDSRLFTDCLKHASRYNRQIIASDVLALVHPFYLSLTQMHYLGNEEVKKEAADYLERITGILEGRKNKNSLGIVAFESAFHYAAVTSLLLERELVDAVFLTEYDSGRIALRSDVSELREKRLFFGEGYAGRCLSRTIDEMKYHVPEKRMWAVRELTVCSPLDGTRALIPVRVRGVDPERVISLDTFKEMVPDFQNNSVVELLV